jgi:hypothetical protein
MKKTTTKLNLSRLFRLLSQRQLLRLLNLIPPGTRVSAMTLSDATGLTVGAVIRQMSEARKCGLVEITADAQDWYFQLSQSAQSPARILLSDLQDLFQLDAQLRHEKDKIRQPGD